MNCLLVKTKDNRRFLTHKAYLPHLQEFAKTFGAKVFLVKAQKGSEILEMERLAPAICDAQQKPKPKYEIINVLIPKKTRPVILKTARRIQRHIRKQLLTGHVVSLKSLKKKYKDLAVTDACLCNHLSVARKYLDGLGYSIKKVGGGAYCLMSSTETSSVAPGMMCPISELTNISTL